MAGEQDASIGISVKADDRSLDRIKQSFPEIERSVQRLKQTFQEMGSAAQQRFSSFEQLVGKMAGGFTPQDLTRMRQSQRELIALIRQNYRERLRLDEEYFQQQERLEGARNRGRMSGLTIGGRGDRRGIATEREQHRFEMEWLRDERMRARHGQQRWLEERISTVGGMTGPAQAALAPVAAAPARRRDCPPCPGDCPPCPGGGRDGGGRDGGDRDGGGGGGRRPSLMQRVLGGRLSGVAGGLLRAAGGLVGAMGGPLTLAAVGYATLREGMSEIDDADVIRRLGTRREQLPPGQMGEGGFLETRRRLFAPEGAPWTYAEGRRGMSGFAGRAGTGAARDLGLQAMNLGIGFGVGAQGGAEAFGTFARYGASQFMTRVRNPYNPGGEVAGQSREITTPGQSQLHFAELLAEHIVKAQMRGREGEVFQRLTEFLELSSRYSLNPANVQDYFSLQQRLLGAAGSPGQQQLVRAGAGQAIWGAVHQAIAGTDLFPGFGGPEILQAILFQSTMARGGNFSEMQERLQTDPLSFLPDLLKHPLITGAPGGGGNIMLSKMLGGLSIPLIKLLRQSETVTSQFTGMPADLQGYLTGEQNERRVQAYMAAYQEYLQGPKSPETREELRQTFQKIRTEVGLTWQEQLQKDSAKAQNEMADLLGKLVPIVTTAITTIAVLTGAINRLIEGLMARGMISKVTSPISDLGAKIWNAVTGQTLAQGQEAPTAEQLAKLPLDVQAKYYEMGGPRPAGAPPAAAGGVAGAPAVAGGAAPSVATALTMPGPRGDPWWRDEMRLPMAGPPTIPNLPEPMEFPTAMPGRRGDRWWEEPITGLSLGAGPKIGTGGGTVGGRMDGGGGQYASKIPRPSQQVQETYGQMIKAWALATGYPEELAWATLMGESGSFLNAGQAVPRGASGEYGPMQLNPRYFPTAGQMSEKENVWTGLMHLKSKLDQYGAQTGLTRYMGQGPEAEQRGEERWRFFEEMQRDRAANFGGGGRQGVSVTVTIPPVKLHAHRRPDWAGGGASHRGARRVGPDGHGRCGVIHTKTRNPFCTVSIISNGGMASVPVDSKLLQPSLLSVTTSRDIHSAAGTFQITLLPRRAGGAFGALTWNDIIHPMDHVTIRMWVPPNKPRIVMTGFVDTIADQFTIAGGRPAHSIVVTGRDYGMLLLVTKLFMFDYNREGIPQPLKIIGAFQVGMDALTNARKYRTHQSVIASSEIIPGVDSGSGAGTWGPEQEAGLPAPSPQYTPINVLKVLWNLIVKPQYQQMQTFFEERLPPIDFIVDVNSSEDDELITYAPYMVLQRAQYTDAWTLFRNFQHRPWRDLYWEDTDDGPRFFYRSAAWLDFDGTLIMPSDVDVVPIEERDLIDYSLGRHAEAIRNFFMTNMAVGEAYTQASKLYGVDIQGMYAPGPIFQSNPYLVGAAGRITFPESSSDFHRVGLRPMEEGSIYIDTKPNQTKEFAEEAKQRTMLLGVQWNQKLVDAFNHGGLLESGTMSVQGTEAAKIGCYIKVMPEGANYYVEGISHRFQWGTQPQDGHFITSMAVSRGRGHLLRTGQGGPGLS